MLALNDRSGSGQWLSERKKRPVETRGLTSMGAAIPWRFLPMPVSPFQPILRMSLLAIESPPVKLDDSGRWKNDWSVQELFGRT